MAISREELEKKMENDENNSLLSSLQVEDDEHESKESVLQRYFLQEWKLVKSLLDDIVLNRGACDLLSVHKIRSIMDKYQEQGQLLEPYLESIVLPLMSIVRSRAAEQVSDLELAVSLLDKCHNINAATSLRQESTGEMEAKCIMLLWLSILVLIPFDLSSVDTSMADDSYVHRDEPPPLVIKILGFCKDYLSNAGPMRTIAGLLLSKLLTRPDMSKAFTSFIDWTHEILSSVEDNVIDHFRLLGAVEALAAIFKIGNTKALLNMVPIVWSDTSALMKSNSAARSPLLRKYLVKLTQRIGLTCLPHRSPTWCYVGRNSILGENVSSNVKGDSNQLNHAVNMDTSSFYQSESSLEDEDMDVPEIVEEIIELLLSGLRDTDTVVRWSAAKGIGRVTSRLTYSLSDEVLSSVLERFSPYEGDGSWHGGCLALAELARRGLLLPISFPKVVPVIIKALHYDVRRGPHSVGSHVRDAAAYVCWAFGRSYYHRDMKSVLEQLAPHLLVVACYDREVNCRRAAAAAFQENVGRQGNFPHGIDIVNMADYFALSSRVNSYLHVAFGIAQYDGYLYPFVDELMHSKISHWDKSLRELAANALSSLVKFEPEYFANMVLEKLIPCTLSSDLCMRHGATLATGEVVLALHEGNYVLSTDKQKMVANMVPAIEKARLYRGKGGEIMRSAVSRFIECIARVQLHLTEKIKRSLLDTLAENLRHPNSHIQKAAFEALEHYVPAYLLSMESKGVNNITTRYLEQLTDPNVASRRGSALGLGVLPFQLLARDWKPVLSKLCSSCAVEDNPEDRDAEARVNAVKALVSICETLTDAEKFSDFFSEEDGISLFLFIRREVMCCLFKALDDYSVDNRGDVGSWVREAAMDGLERCTYILCKRESLDIPCRSQGFNSITELHDKENVQNDQIKSFFDANLATNLVGGIAKQAVEKMDKIRESAARVLQRILYNKAIFVPYIPYRGKLENIVPNEADIKWGVPTFSYPRFVQLLRLNCYSKYIISGLVISIGGLQDSLRKASLSALLDYLQSTETEGQYNSREFTLSTDILWVLQKYERCDRVIIPTLKTIEILFSKKILLNMEAQTTIFCAGVLDSLAIELRRSKDFSKLCAGIAVLGYIASILEPINIRAFSQLLSFLEHRYPKIRKSAAEQVYLVLLENVNLMSEDKVDKAVEIITETCWEGDIEEAKSRRLRLCDMANIKTEQILKATNAELNKIVRQTPTADENASYSSLVGSAGF
ncbi:unnamed protein product [Fraxinus pennsylvanica]|uniref:Tubulin-specific chaperone D n=1 Tax=Fraxinus pennsylvanica TaxID=56036 RepID=A0AAD2DYJ0_9LAMI|nr:unnamed protein product [Fraxinus pennsylvanica]